MTRGHWGRLLILAGLSLLIAVFSYEAFSEELAVIEVRRNIPLSDTDPVYKDYYLNAGINGGLKKNMVVTAIRKISIKDATGTNSFGDVEVPVGQLKIIAVQNRMAVAREFKLIPRDEEPMLEQIGVMIGDTISLAGSFVDNKKASAKKSE